MKLKIIINKMSNFINNITKIILQNISSETKSYKYNYFDEYVNSVNNNETQRVTAIKIIEDNSELITEVKIKEIKQIISKDISNQSIIVNDKKLEYYVIFSLFMYIYDSKISKEFIENGSFINIKQRERTDVLVGDITIKDLTFDIYLKPRINFDHIKKIENKLSILLENKCPLPYCAILREFIVYEKCMPIFPKNDPLIEVLKDIINQLKNINKYFWLQYIDKDSIGKSEFGLKRYFIFFLDSLILKEDKLTCYNVYDGRITYDEITPKDQVRTVVNILSNIYVQGRETFTQKVNVYPFSEYLDFLNSSDNDDKIYDKFILYLMGIKNERGEYKS